MDIGDLTDLFQNLEPLAQDIAALDRLLVFARASGHIV